MADSDQIRSGLQIFLQRKASTRVKNTLFKAMPTFDFLTGLNGDKKSADGLGRIEAGNLAIGRINGVSRPMKEKLFREREYLPIVQISKPSKSELKDMTDYDNNPTVPAWDTTNRTLARFVQPRFKFSRVKMPCKIAHSEKRTAEANAGGSDPAKEAARAISSVFEVEDKTREAVMCEVLNDRLFGINGASGAPADEDAVTWSSYHSIANALGTSNTYGGIDRSSEANAWWRGNQYSTAFTGTFEDLINHANYKLFAATGEHGGVGGLKAKGQGITAIAVGGDLLIRAKNEAKTRGYQLQTGAIPDPEYGFKGDIVWINAGGRRIPIFYEPAMDTVSATTAYCFDFTTWTIAIPADRNFTTSKIMDLSTLSEGGDEADAWRKEAEILMCCEVPSGNAIYSNIQ
jgi:hypothetical protein